MAEQVAVVELRAAAKLSHARTQLGIYEGVDDNGRPPPRPRDGEREVVDGLDPRMTDDLERRIGELRLERRDEARGGLASRVGHDVHLHERLGGHGERLAARAF
jgi:hypothetical protein